MESFNPIIKTETINDISIEPLISEIGVLTTFKVSGRPEQLTKFNVQFKQLGGKWSPHLQRDTGEFIKTERKFVPKIVPAPGWVFNNDKINNVRLLLSRGDASTTSASGESNTIPFGKTQFTPSQSQVPNSGINLSGLIAPNHSNINPNIRVTAQTGPGYLSFSTTQLSEGCSTSFIQNTLFSEIPNEELQIKLDSNDKRTLLSILQERENLLPELEVEFMSLSFFDSAELLKTGIRINNGGSNGMGTVNDPKLGMINRDEACSTCMKTVVDCTGHTGVIKLNIKMYHPSIMRMLIRILTSVCNSCGGLLLTEKEMRDSGMLKYNGFERLKMIEAKSKNKSCRRKNTQGCTPTNCTITENECDTDRRKIEKGASVPDPIKGNIKVGPIRPCRQNPIFKTNETKDKNAVTYNCDNKDKVSRTLNIETVSSILNGISDYDAQLLGFRSGEHPRKFIITAIPVLPPCARSIVPKDGAYNDNLGDHYKTIINLNNNIEKVPVSDKNARDTLIRNLISNINDLIKYEDNGQRKGKQGFKSFYQLFKSKKGFIRKEAEGKRVNFSARSVAGIEPNLKINQVGVPRAWASILTVPEWITNDNRESIMDLLKQGRITYIIPGSGRNINQRIRISEKNRDTYNLREGDEISRWLQNGDYVIVNRQPTIHKYGMMGHEVVLHDDMTVKIHPGITTPYNADFDGDEINIHVPQTAEAIEEVRTIMGVSNCLMNAQSNKPIVAFIQDTLTGTYLLTQPDTTVDIDTWYDITMNLLSNDHLSLDVRLEKHKINKHPIVDGQPDKSKIFGRAVFSSVLPADFYYHKVSGDDEVLVIDGVLIKGIITKSSIGTTFNSMVQEIWKKYGEDRTINFLTDLPRVSDKFLMERGFSVGLKDCYLPNREDRAIAMEELAKAMVLIESMGVRPDNPLEEERKEKDIIAHLANAVNIGRRIAKKNIPMFNAFMIMADSGAKGSPFNISQITTMMGQIFVGGKRMPEGLAYFEKGDINPQSRGLVTSSFRSGLSLAEFFYSQLAGRENLADTSVKTASVGYIHRQLVKALENVIVKSDGTVRDGNNIIQFVYGNDGLDPKYLQKISDGDRTMTSFINVKSVVGEINAKYGYY